MKKLFLPLFILFVICFANYHVYTVLYSYDPVEIKRRYEELPSKCLPDAIVMCEYMRNKGHESNVIVFHCKSPEGEEMCHAVTFYVWLGSFYIWDKGGSSFIPPTVDKNDAKSIISAKYSHLQSARFVDYKNPFFNFSNFSLTN